MTTFLDRYQQGECEEVWADLLALGEQVRTEPFYTDALAVARETMRRARGNIELLLERLPRPGYAFGYTWANAPEQEWLALQPPVFAQPKPDVQERLAELERLVGPLPLALHAWYEHVGAVNLVGSAPGEWTVATEMGLDPLQVCPIEEQLAHAQAWQDECAPSGQEAGSPFCVTIAPDFYVKEQVSGGGPYHILLPNAAADALLLGEWHQTTFVNYLRLCFRWGGLPGLEHAAAVPRKDLAVLTEGLLPL